MWAVRAETSVAAALDPPACVFLISDQDLTDCGIRFDPVSGWEVSGSSTVEMNSHKPVMIGFIYLYSCTCAWIA